MKFGENVKKLRMERELTQGDLAQALSVTPQTVSRWESGQALPDLLLLSDIADYFDRRASRKKLRARPEKAGV